MREALDLLDQSGLGVLLLVSSERELERTVTDGDLRRLLLEGALLDHSLANMPRKRSIVIAENHTRREALALMQQHTIDHLPVVDAEGRVIDLVERRGIDDQILLSIPHMGETERDYVEEAFRTNWIAPLGPNVDAFENELAEKVGAQNAVALSSGTAAIHLALVLLDVGPGDKVFCSSLTFAASVNPIAYQGAEPVLIDSEPESWNMSPAALERALEAARKMGRLPKAVIVVIFTVKARTWIQLSRFAMPMGYSWLRMRPSRLGPKYGAKLQEISEKSAFTRSTATRSLRPPAAACWLPRRRSWLIEPVSLATQARDPHHTINTA